MNAAGVAQVGIGNPQVAVGRTPRGALGKGDELPVGRPDEAGDAGVLEFPHIEAKAAALTWRSALRYEKSGPVT